LELGWGSWRKTDAPFQPRCLPCHPSDDSSWLSPMIGPSMSHLSDVIGPSACWRQFSNEFLHTICVCSACHIINWRQRQFACTAARRWWALSWRQEETHANQLRRWHAHQSTCRGHCGVTVCKQLNPETLNRGQTSHPKATLHVFSTTDQVIAKRTFDSKRSLRNGFPLTEWSVVWTINHSHESHFCVQHSHRQNNRTTQASFAKQLGYELHKTWHSWC
jgi:hypothetical protein